MNELTLNSLEKNSMLKIIDDYEPSEEILQEYLILFQRTVRLPRG
jgi:hypothetical protein